MKDTREDVRLNKRDSEEAKRQLIQLLQSEGKLQLEKITHEDSVIRYHFCTNHHEYKNVVVDIATEDELDCGELETFAV